MKLSKIAKKLIGVSSCTLEQLKDGSFKASYHFITKENKKGYIIKTCKYKSIKEDIELTSKRSHHFEKDTIYKFFQLETYKNRTNTKKYINLYLNK